MLYPNTDTNIELLTALLHPKALRTQFPTFKKNITQLTLKSNLLFKPIKNLFTKNKTIPNFKGLA